MRSSRLRSPASSSRSFALPASTTRYCARDERHDVELIRGRSSLSLMTVVPTVTIGVGVLLACLGNRRFPPVPSRIFFCIDGVTPPGTSGSEVLASVCRRELPERGDRAAGSVSQKTLTGHARRHRESRRRLTRWPPACTFPQRGRTRATIPGRSERETPRPGCARVDLN